MMNVITMEQVNKTYLVGDNKIEALKDVSISIPTGSFLAVCGPSGSGKTTLLNMIGCLDRPTTGVVKLLGHSIHLSKDCELSKLRNKHIGFIFQSFNLIPVLNIYENVEYPLLIQGVKDRKSRVMKIIDEVGLSEYVKHKPSQLSGGQKQRVAIARALVTLPNIVLADEPTANLDSATGEKILDLMHRINKEHNTTFVFSTHDHKVLKSAEVIYYLRDGIISVTE